MLLSLPQSISNGPGSVIIVVMLVLAGVTAADAGDAGGETEGLMMIAANFRIFMAHLR